jgi:predicted transposase YdaD
MITERLVLPYEVWREKGRAEGRAEGKAEGKAEAKKAVAVSLFGLLPDEVIAEKTGLTLDELKDLKNYESPA